MASTSKELASTYQKKTQLEHIKDAPDTYIGGIEEDRVINWTMKEDKMTHAEYGFIPGLYKCLMMRYREAFLEIFAKRSVQISTV